MVKSLNNITYIISVDNVESIDSKINLDGNCLNLKFKNLTRKDK